MTYTHFTQDKRYQIAILAKAGHGQSDIAGVMNRHKSSIGREMARNRGERGYRPKQAHEFSQAGMRACENGPRVAPETWAMVDVKLGETWSPNKSPGISEPMDRPPSATKAYADKRAGGTLHRTLRCQKARRKRYGSRERRGTIPNPILAVEAAGGLSKPPINATYQHCRVWLQTQLMRSSGRNSANA